MNLEKTIHTLGVDDYLIKLLGFFMGSLVLSSFCFIDDLKGIKPLVKLIGQIFAAAIIAFSGIRIDQINIASLNTILNVETISIIITILWIVGITNAINLLDGLDGLSSGIALISCISLLMIFSLNGSPILSIILITALAGAIVGFLPFNFNPAKTFIGDTGANFLGFSLAIISILGVAKTYTAIVLIAPLIIFALPIFDTFLAIIRRMAETKTIRGVFKADRKHLHHKLVDNGYSQKQAVFILYGITATLGMFTIILLENGIIKAVSFGIMVFLIVLFGLKDILQLRKIENKEVK